MPGAGKTAAMIDLLQDLAKDRPVFVHFDPKERLRPEQKLLHETLLIPHQPVNAATWHEEVSDGGILVIDEAQGCWRPRGPAAKVPEAIAALETHRHAGIDIFITTQSPRLIDANVRGLVGRHVHIRDTGWLGRWWYEWPEVNEGLAWKTCPVKKRYKLPRKVFDLYASANEHHKPVRAAPKTLALVAVLLVCLTVLVGLIVRTFKNHTAEKPAAAVPAPQAPQVPQALPVNPVTVEDDDGMNGSLDERIAFVPRLSDRPWTAPAYDGYRVVVHMPVVAGAICKGDECICLTADGAKVPDMSAAACKTWLQSPRPFNPYVLPPPPAASVPVGRGGRGGAVSGDTEPGERQTVAVPGGSANVVPMADVSVNLRSAIAGTGQYRPAGSGQPL